MKTKLLWITILAFAFLIAGVNHYAAQKISKPETAAKTFYNAWKRNDRAAALQVASLPAVNEMFSTRWRRPDWEFAGCEKSGAGYNCFYRYEAGGAVMRVTGGPASGYRVQSVQFHAD